MFELVREKSKTDKITARNDIMDSGIQHVQEKSDVAETIKELNDDTTIDKFTKIDMKTRLLPIEISAIISLDSLVALDFLSSKASFITRSKKRLAVSLNGEGRKEIVAISQGIKEQQTGTNIFEKMGNWFKGGQ